MPFDPQSVAFLRLLQDDVLGPPREDREAVNAEAARRVLAALPEDTREAAAAAAFSGAQPPTPHEWPQAYSILAELADEVVHALAEDVILTDPPLVGTLPLRFQTALLLRVPDSTKHLAIVDTEFTTFANLLAKACALALIPSDDGSEETWEAELKGSAHPAVQRYVELMSATLFKTPSAAPQYIPPTELYWMVNQLVTAIEVFVLSEPFVHMAIGNAGTASPVTVATLHPQAQSYLWTESDRFRCFAMRLMVTASVFDTRGYPDKAIGYWAIQMFLFTLALIHEVHAPPEQAETAESSWIDQELGWLPEVLQHLEGENSRAVALFNRLTPIRVAFAEQLHLALTEPRSGLH
jgi:hypothetical protein